MLPTSKTNNYLTDLKQLKMKKKAREEQEELAFDLKMLEQLLEESRNEAMEQLQRKVYVYFMQIRFSRIVYFLGMATNTKISIRIFDPFVHASPTKSFFICSKPCTHI